MSTDLINRVLRVGEGRAMKAMQKRVARIGDLEAEVEKLSDEELRGRADVFRARLAGDDEAAERLQAGESLDAPLAELRRDWASELADLSKDELSERLDDLLNDAFAVVREAGKRALGMRLYDVQLIGAMTLHEGTVAEMKTGEGKTLTSTPAVYLNALAGRGVHVVTVNDYLASRDAEWMMPVYRALGVSVGVILSQMPEDQRRAAYAADITYGTNAEFGFDYLRDNMAVRLADCVQRGHYFCVVDEVDSILIDEARTPLIISGVPEAATDTYYRFARVVPTLKKGTDYDVDEKHRAASPTESGVHKVEKALGIDNLYTAANGNLVNHLIQALKAHALYRKDKEYIVRDGELLIVDEFTGRVLEGRRYSEGLHQALEAKEGLRIREENQTLATITLQNYFRMYDKLSGMTGTAATEANEFAKIYKTDVLSVPTNRPVVRKDHNDFIFKTKEAKFNAVANDIAEAQERGQPVLVGTISVGVSEMLSGLLTRRGVKHDVLNAKNHAREAEIILNAGQPGAVTIATNMAGRGVDIKLGEGVRELGGLMIIGTERHESRRIDNQLRGRSGRQGDPGVTRFYLSAEDDLVRIFAGDRIYKILDRLGPGDDLPIEAKMLTKTVEGAQKKVEEQNFNIRKRVLEYDDVLNKQREVIYAERRRVLEGADLGEQARDWIAEALVGLVEEYSVEDTMPADWDLEGLFTAVNTLIPLELTVAEFRDQLEDPENPLTGEELLDTLEDDAMALYERREEDRGADLTRDLERWVLLQLVDQNWREHLYGMDYLREGIHLRALGQKDPLSEYRLEGHRMFDELMDIVKTEFVRYMFHVEVESAPEAQPAAVADVGYTYQDDPVQGAAAAVDPGAGAVTQEAGEGMRPVAQRILTEEEQVGRNDPCPCGSGKKYKHCHGGPNASAQRPQTSEEPVS